ncbi:hypothetical protein CALVIDRAFT_525563 [Calocera viscosa TUFC12733]|uniref:Uncharacterized protein n=1 Tax=Calocera viscosa (strain TUFC12733) TaxID=1330018 RepID=A0A167PPZ2_CALVF|nr:hypothetical protein CALVIDRAFT_525563 [Calocera viscosa TUFC12733]
MPSGRSTRRTLASTTNVVTDDLSAVSTVENSSSVASGHIDDGSSTESTIKDDDELPVSHDATTSAVPRSVTPVVTVPVSDDLAHPVTPVKESSSVIKTLVGWLNEAHNLADEDILKALSWKYVEDVGTCLTDGDDVAHLSIIGMISPMWFALSPDGGWEPGNSRSAQFSKHKASAYLVAPLEPPFNSMYDDAMKNFQRLEERGCRDGYEVLSGLKRSGLKVSWPLFEKRPTNPSASFVSEVSQEVPDEPDGEAAWYGWHVCPELAWHLSNIKSTH